MLTSELLENWNVDGSQTEQASSLRPYEPTEQKRERTTVLLEGVSVSASRNSQEGKHSKEFLCFYGVFESTNLHYLLRSERRSEIRRL